ncbi:MAG: DUF952 domain-containing protein [Acidobacteriota bacterium]
MRAVLVFKLVPAHDWQEAEVAGMFTGSPVDRRDGFIHFSTAEQVHETAARHFAGISGLLVVAVRTEGLALRWEPSRAGALFPHLYGDLPLAAVCWARPLELGSDGRHVFPELA